VPETDYQKRLEVIWQKVRPHLEWAQGFTLVVLFTRHPAPVDALRTRLREVLSLNTIPLRFFELKEPDQAGELLQAVLSSRPLNGKRPPLWLEMWKKTGAAEEQSAQKRAVWEVLSRLNERRFLLERDVACPLVLVLPAELRQDIPAMTPDLWSVRAVTADLPTPEVRSAVIQIYDIGPPETTINVSMEDPKSKIQGFAINNPSAAEQEWLRLWAATPDKQRLNPDAAFPAITSALEREDHTAAREFLNQAMQVINQRGDTPAAMRQRGTAHAYLGDLELAASHLEEARTAYTESLDLRRQLREASGETPQALRDLSVSLDNIGNVEQALNRFEEARAAYVESLELCRRLREATGDTPEALRDLSVSLSKIGDVEEALNRFEGARAAYAESLGLHRRLREATGDTPQALRDLSVSLSKIGDFEQALNRFEEARAAYAESLELCRRLREASGDTPQALRDLSISLDKIGNVEEALNRFEEARAAFAESLELRRRLQ
jgi:tetratricopeptide (TPR) repeat protein